MIDDEKIIFQTVKMMITSVNTGASNKRHVMYFKGRYTESLYKKLQGIVDETIDFLAIVSKKRIFHYELRILPLK